MFNALMTPEYNLKMFSLLFIFFSDFHISKKMYLRGINTFGTTKNTIFANFANFFKKCDNKVNFFVHFRFLWAYAMKILENGVDPTNIKG